MFFCYEYFLKPLNISFDFTGKQRFMNDLKIFGRKNGCYIFLRIDKKLPKYFIFFCRCLKQMFRFIT